MYTNSVDVRSNRSRYNNIFTDFNPIINVPNTSHQPLALNITCENASSVTGISNLLICVI